jgi:soluble lytic murein transglycosylase
MMQLLYSTARPVARKYGMDSLSVSDLYNPTINIKLGVALLADLFSNYGKSEYVAAAYNAGPGRLSQWRRSLPSTSMEEWVESIPISETRLYIQGVTRNPAQYRRLYDEAGVSRVPVVAADKK